VQREARELIVAVPDGTTAQLDLPDRSTYIVDPGIRWVQLALAADRRTDRLLSFLASRAPSRKETADTLRVDATVAFPFATRHESKECAAFL
jgi:hypothetical protein